MSKKVIIAVIAVVAVVAGAFVGGMLAVDPTGSDEYKSLARELGDTEKELDTAKADLEDTEADLEEASDELADAQAQVNALSSKIPADGVAQGTPAVSNGAAVAPRNFRLDVRTRSKECFGSAGCLLTVQIDPNYVGNQDVSSGTWEIIYELRGGEDGPVIETMTLKNGTFSFPSEQDLSTSSSSAVITAVVTEVYPL